MKRKPTLVIPAPQKFLSGELTLPIVDSPYRLIPYSLEMAESLYQSLGEPDLMKFFRTESAIQSLEDAKKHLEQGIQECNEGKRFPWIITDTRAPNSVIGIISLTDIVRPHNRATLGWLVINPKYQGQGIARMAASKVLEWAFKIAHFTWIQADIAVNNAASRRVVEKLGFRLSCVWENYMWIDDDCAVDIAVYFMTREMHGRE